MIAITQRFTEKT